MPAPESKALAKARPSKCKLWFSAPRNREPLHKALSASRMRDHRSAAMTFKTKLEMQQCFQDSLQKLRELGLLRDGCKTRVAVRNNIIAIDVPGSRRALPIPFEAMQCIASLPIQRSADVARAFGVDAKSVPSVRCLISQFVRTRS